MPGFNVTASRLQNQGLLEPRPGSAANIVGWLGAVQAQDYGAAKWGIGLRLAGATDTDVESAFNAGDILRTHVMRPTWHFVLPADIRWLLALTSPRVHPANARIYRALELDESVLARCHGVLRQSLRGAHLTRAELGARLRDEGIEAEGQRLAYILMEAELEGVICSGPRRGKQFTYALLDERAPTALHLDREEALSELTWRYFRSHGPAQARDFAWWSGLMRSDVERGLAFAGERLACERLDGKTYWFSDKLVDRKEVRKPVAHLLSIYDEYTIAYNDRSALGEGRVLEGLISMGNALTAVVVIDGRIAGTWKRQITRTAVEVRLDLSRQVTEVERGAIEAAARRYGDFLESECRVEGLEVGG